MTDLQEVTVEWALERLRQLRSEYADGEAQAMQLDRRRAQVHEAMLRVAFLWVLEPEQASCRWTT